MDEGGWGRGPEASARKQFMRGTHRLVSPEETVARVRRWMPVMGITRVANLTGLDTLGIPVMMAYRPNGRSLSVSSGKGLTLAAARASALMEAIETYHAERILLPLKLASHNELRFTHPVVDVEALPRLSVSAFHSDKPLLWIEGQELMGGQPCWVPYELVHSNYTLPLPTGSGCFPMTSNGLASGNHLLEAISHGICEVVERDAMTLWQAGARTAYSLGRRVDPATVDDASCRELLERLHQAGLAVGVWDLTSDVGIPTLRAVIVDREPNPFRELYTNGGTGCHPVREVALLRALTEAVQGRLIYISGARDDRDREAYARARQPDRVRRVREQLETLGPAPRSFQDVPRHEWPDFADEVRWALGRLAAVGIRQVVAVDLTRPEFDIPVVRIVIPGLESIRELSGYVPGPRARALPR